MWVILEDVLEAGFHFPLLSVVRRTGLHLHAQAILRTEVINWFGLTLSKRSWVYVLGDNVVLVAS